MSDHEKEEYADIDDLLASSEEEIERGAAQVRAELARNQVYVTWCRNRLARLRSQRRRASQGLHLELARLITAQWQGYPEGYVYATSRFVELRRGRVVRLLADIQRVEDWLREALLKDRALTQELAQLLVGS